MKNSFISLGVISAVVIFVATLTCFFEPTYTVRGRGLVMPLEEWVLFQGSGGHLFHIHENHLDGVVGEFGVSEIQRGDVVQYLFDESLIKAGRIQRGDTLARVTSSNIQLQIVELEGELAYQKSLLAAHKAGERPEDIRVAEGRIELARQELQTQQLLTDRVVRLYEEEVVPEQEVEISLNELRVKEHALDIAQAQYSALRAGRKPEDLQVIRSTISSLKTHIDQLKKHIEAFHLVSPLTGKVVRDRSPLWENNDVVLRIADVSSYVVLVPVDHSEVAYLTIGQAVRIESLSTANAISGKLFSIDKTIRLINNRPKIFLTVLVTEDKDPELLRNMMVDVQIDCGSVTAWEYLLRLTRTVYHN